MPGAINFRVWDARLDLSPRVDELSVIADRSVNVNGLGYAILGITISRGESPEFASEFVSVTSLATEAIDKDPLWHIRQVAIGLAEHISRETETPISTVAMQLEELVRGEGEPIRLRIDGTESSAVRYIASERFWVAGSRDPGLPVAVCGSVDEVPELTTIDWSVWRAGLANVTGHRTT